MPKLGRRGGIAQHGRARHVWCNLLAQFEPFPAQAIFKIGEAGCVCARMRHAGDEAGADRIDDGNENRRHGAGSLLNRRDRHAAAGEDHIRRERRRFCGIPAKSAGITRRPAHFNLDVAANAPTQ